MVEFDCIISDRRVCKQSYRKDTVFIIGSGSAEFEKDLNAVKEVLERHGLKGDFALLNNKEKGFDAFCNKICSHILGARFCIVILNDPVALDYKAGEEKKVFRAPRPNVYYEYGLAVALKKRIIPIIQKKLSLPFDVQHIDAIVYESLDSLRKQFDAAVLETMQKTTKEDLLSDKQKVEMEYFRYPVLSELCCFTEQFFIHFEGNVPELGSQTKEKYILRNRSRNLPVKETGRFEEWVSPETKVYTRVIRVLSQEEARNLGFTISRETKCKLNSFESPVIKDVADTEWRIIFSSVAFEEPLLPGEVIGIEILSESVNAFNLEDCYIFKSEWPTEKACIQLIAPPGYSIYAKTFSVRDTGNHKLYNVMNELEEKEQIPRTDRTTSTLVWEIENPVLIYEYRVDFKIENASK